MAQDEIADETAYFVPTGPGRYRPTLHVQGAWSEDEQHIGALSGLITHEVLRHEPRAELQLGRITFEVLGRLAREEVSIEVSTLRPGRTIELLEATATIGERVVVRARAWRLQTSDSSDVAALEMPTLPPQEQCEPYDAAAQWKGQFLRSFTYRSAPNGRPGRRSVWVSTDIPLIEGEDAEPLATYMVRVDPANGVATRVHPEELMFPSIDLTVHFVREPDPAWVGLDTSVSFGNTGIGLTSTHLHDVHGVVGHAEQLLTIRRHP